MVQRLISSYTCITLTDEIDFGSRFTPSLARGRKNAAFRAGDNHYPRCETDCKIDSLERQTGASPAFYACHSSEMAKGRVRSRQTIADCRCGTRTRSHGSLIQTPSAKWLDRGLRRHQRTIKIGVTGTGKSENRELPGEQGSDFRFFLGDS